MCYESKPKKLPVAVVNHDSGWEASFQSGNNGRRDAVHAVRRKPFSSPYPRIPVKVAFLFPCVQFSFCRAEVHLKENNSGDADGDEYLWPCSASWRAEQKGQSSGRTTEMEIKCATSFLSGQRAINIRLSGNLTAHFSKERFLLQSINFYDFYASF